MSHQQKMNGVYALQHRFYDLTRGFFLFGRNRLVDSLAICPDQSVLEIGCGTGRNLIRLANKHPYACFFGLDASSVMLQAAQKKINRAGHKDRIVTEHGLVEEMSPQQTMDTIFFSYSLSMCADWKKALQQAFNRLSPKGAVHIVDFWDQKGWPFPLGPLFKKWLSLFHVSFDPEWFPALETLAEQHHKRLAIRSIGPHYAFFASVF